MINTNKTPREGSLNDIRGKNHGRSEQIAPATARVLGQSTFSKLGTDGPILTAQHTMGLDRLPPVGPSSIVGPNSLARISRRDRFFGNCFPASELKASGEDLGIKVEGRRIDRTVVNNEGFQKPRLQSVSAVSPLPSHPQSSVLRRKSESDSRMLERGVSIDHVGGLNWIRSQPVSQINLSCLRKEIGPKRVESFEPAFCDVQTIIELQQLRKSYYKLSKHHSRDARTRSNPYELIGNGLFQNRAGMKLANIDADLGFILTDQRKQEGSHSGGASSDILYFVDICAGPGGFSEYVLYRKGFDSKGFGITLRNTELDLNIDEIKAGPSECYEAYYGAKNNGDIYDPANVKSFVNLVIKSTENLGVQLAVADGGIEVDGQELMQETLCKQLYLSQFLIALNVLREKGNFVCKLFETYSLFSIGLIYLMHLCFDETTIYKPRMSRPQNGERYIICKHKRSQAEIEPIIKYFTESHQLLWEWATKKSPSQLQEFDILQLVPLEVLQKNTESGFFEKMRGFNIKLAQKQIQALKAVQLYVEDPDRKDERQEKIRQQCHEEWKIPVTDDRRPGNKSGVNNCVEMTDETFQRLWVGVNIDIRNLKEHVLVSSEFDSIFKSPYDWRVIVVQGDTNRKSRGFYMGQGGKDVFRFNISTSEWEEAPISIELPKDTLVFGECVTEYETFGSRPNKPEKVFHLIDGLIINGKDIRHLHYITRHEILSKLAKSVNKASRLDLSVVRAKQLVRMENIEDVLDKCKREELKGESGSHWTCPIDHTDEWSPVTKAAGILFLKLTKDPWVMALSKSSNRKYWFNQNDGKSFYTVPSSAVSNFFDTMQHRIMWQWTADTNLDVPDDSEHDMGISVLDPKVTEGSGEAVHSLHFLKYLRKYLRPSPSEPITPK